MNDTTFELSKMAVTNGVGTRNRKKLLQHCLIFALESDIQKNYSVLQQKIKSTIYLYENLALKKFF
jgi:hypothetical protein